MRHVFEDSLDNSGKVDLIMVGIGTWGHRILCLCHGFSAIILKP